MWVQSNHWYLMWLSHFSLLCLQIPWGGSVSFHLSHISSPRPTPLSTVRVSLHTLPAWIWRLRASVLLISDCCFHLIWCLRFSVFTRNFVNVAALEEEMFNLLISFGKLLIRVLGPWRLGQAFPYLQPVRRVSRSHLIMATKGEAVDIMTVKTQGFLEEEFVFGVGGS